MVLVTFPATKDARAFVAHVVALGLVACTRSADRGASVQADTPARGLASAEPATPPGSAVPASSAAGPASAASASSAPAAAPSVSVPGATRAGTAAYPALAEHLDPSCADPRVVLAVRKQYDRSGRVWVAQALVANPEFHVVPEKAGAPGEVDLYETIYGIKSFAPKPPGVPYFSEAVVGRCADAGTCERLGAMFHAVSPRDTPKLVCGTPPATTGGFARVRELGAAVLRAPDASAPPPAACARVHACLAREGAAARPDPTCREVAKADLGACAALSECGAVAACLRERGH